MKNYNPGIGEHFEGLLFLEFLQRIASLAKMNKSFSDIAEMDLQELEDIVLEYLERKPVIVFLDNFEDVVDEERKKYSEFFDKIHYHKHTKIILTTRPGRGKSIPMKRFLFKT